MGKYVVDCAILPVVEIVFLCCLFFGRLFVCFCYLKLPIATYYNFSLDSVYYYPTAPRRVQITPKTSKNITRYLYSRGPVGQVFSQHASDELD